MISELTNVPISTFPSRDKTIRGVDGVFGVYPGGTVENGTLSIMGKTGLYSRSIK